MQQHLCKKVFEQQTPCTVPLLVDLIMVTKATMVLGESFSGKQGRQSMRRVEIDAFYQQCAFYQVEKVRHPRKRTVSRIPCPWERERSAVKSTTWFQHPMCLPSYKSPMLNIKGVDIDVVVFLNTSPVAIIPFHLKDANILREVCLRGGGLLGPHMENMVLVSGGK